VTKDIRHTTSKTSSPGTGCEVVSLVGSGLERWADRSGIDQEPRRALAKLVLPSEYGGLLSSMLLLWLRGYQAELRAAKEYRTASESWRCHCIGPTLLLETSPACNDEAGSL